MQFVERVVFRRVSLDVEGTPAPEAEAAPRRVRIRIAATIDIDLSE